MSHFYLDASAVVKRYSPEIGSDWVKALTDPSAGHAILLGEITLAEVPPPLPPNIARQVASPRRSVTMHLPYF